MKLMNDQDNFKIQQFNFKDAFCVRKPVLREVIGEVGTARIL